MLIVLTVLLGLLFSTADAFSTIRSRSIGSRAQTSLFSKSKKDLPYNAFTDEITLQVYEKLKTGVPSADKYAEMEELKSMEAMGEYE